MPEVIDKCAHAAFRVLPLPLIQIYRKASAIGSWFSLSLLESQGRGFEHDSKISLHYPFFKWLSEEKVSVYVCVCECV